MEESHGFDYAVVKLKEGEKLSRRGWNGKGQYIELCDHISYRRSDGTVVNPTHVDMGNAAIVFHGTSGEQVGWLASQSDILSEDWFVLD